ncbi:MAG: CocE/NonD family hydrolase [bacterium]
MSKKITKRAVLKWTGRVLGGLAALVVLIVAIGILFAPDYTRKKTPAGYPINQMAYLPLDARTNVWISVWLPEALEPGETVPAVMETSRYGFKLDPGWLYKVMETYRLQPDPNYGSAEEFVTNGYAYVRVQSPGSCQSSGPRFTEYPPNEIDAMRAAIDWIVRQPWSNGRVGSQGGSYSGTTAEMCCATLHPAHKAVYSVAPDFDPFTVLRPGGLGSTEFIQTWANMIRLMDENDIVGLFALFEGEETLPFWKGLLYGSLVGGLKRPKGDDVAIFQQALVDHQNNRGLYAFLETIEYKDQKSAEFSYSIDDVAMYRYKGEIERAQVNTYTRAGWIDAEVAKGALEKYLTFDTPQKLVIGPTGHHVDNIVDLYGGEGSMPGFAEAPKDICEDMLDYFDRHLKQESSEKEKRRVLYFTYGVNEWNETNVWPPEGVIDKAWYFSNDKRLDLQAPRDLQGSDRHTVDFTATTGDQNRWMAQMGNDVHYADRREEDAKLLTYTSAPLEKDLEMTGSPTVYLYVSSDHEDGAFHVYLEDVSPDGRVTYLTEGLLRAIHRKVKDSSEAPFVPLGIYHSFLAADSAPLIPGEVTEIGITLLPFSTVFRKGHSIRVAVAGHDMSMKDRCPKEGVRNARYPSRLMLPVR